MYTLCFRLLIRINIGLYYRTIYYVLLNYLGQHVVLIVILETVDL